MHLFFSLAIAAQAWTATCASRQDSSVWFIFAAPPAKPDAPPNPDFDCKGLFFDTVPCPTVVTIGKIKAEGKTPGGSDTYALRYMPSADLATALVFLDKPGGGVLYKHPMVVGATPAAQPPPPTTMELMAGYLTQRAKASAATQGITLHTWICPESDFSLPPESIANGMGVQIHQGRAPI